MAIHDCTPDESAIRWASDPLEPLDSATTYREMALAACDLIRELGTTVERQTQTIDGLRELVKHLRASK